MGDCGGSVSVLASQSGAVFWAQRVVPLLPWVLPVVRGIEGR